MNNGNGLHGNRDKLVCWKEKRITYMREEQYAAPSGNGSSRNAISYGNASDRTRTTPAVTYNTPRENSSPSGYDSSSSNSYYGSENNNGWH